jgi:predicted metal-dependent hydrolase
MAHQLRLGTIIVTVVRKDIKNVHLSVMPPDGAVRISAPRRMNMDAIRLFAISKLPWIKQHQKKLREQEREPPRDYVDRESHYVWGRRYLLAVSEQNVPPAVTLKHRTLVLTVRPQTSPAKRQEIVEAWYRRELKAAAAPIIAQWEQRLGIRVAQLFVQRMKTKWGSANPRKRNIRLNTELAKKPPECLEYIILHEMLHFLVPNHSDAFITLLDRHAPGWRLVKQRLNETPLGHVQWAA